MPAPSFLRGLAHCRLLRVDVSFGHREVGMAGQVGESVRVRVLGPASEAGMTALIKHEGRAARLLDRLQVLLLQKAGYRCAYLSGSALTAEQRKKIATSGEPVRVLAARHSVAESLVNKIRKAGWVF